MKPVIGLTGGIGSGKSAASALFARLGITVVDADVVAREVVEPGSEALKQIGEHFGSSVIAADGTLDRRALRSRVFSDPNEKLWLENLLHPLIRDKIRQQLTNAPSPYTLLVSPLLLETDQNRMCERILVIDAPEALQLSRTTQRDSTSETEVAAIMAAQMKREERLRRADDIIVNDHNLEHLHREVLRLHEKYSELARCRHET